VWPAQALAYKIGALQFLAERRRAETPQVGASTSVPDNSLDRSDGTTTELTKLIDYPPALRVATRRQ